MTEELEAELRDEFEDALRILGQCDNNIVSVRRQNTCIAIAYGTAAPLLNRAADAAIGTPQRTDWRAV